MVYRARILEEANRELHDAVSYLAGYSKKAAASFLNGFEHQLELICSETVTYNLSRMSELAELGYHTALVDQYLFLYYLEEDTVVVAHLFHQRQDYAKLVVSSGRQPAATN